MLLDAKKRMIKAVFFGLLFFVFVEGPQALASIDVKLRNDYLAKYADRKYAPLMGLLRKSLSLQEQSQLGEILVARQLALADLPSGPQRSAAEVAAYRNRCNEDAQARILKLYGPAIAKAVDDYLETLPARRVVGELNHILIYQGEGMSVEQMEKLSVLLQQNTVDMGTRSPNDDDLDRYIEASKLSEQSVLKAAAEYLSKVQLLVLKSDFEMRIAYMRSHRSNILTSNGL